MPAIFASGANLSDVVQAPTPGSGLPPSPPAPESPVVDDAASAPEPSTEPEPQPTLLDAEPEPTEGEEPEAEEQLVLPPTNRGQRRFVSNLIRENERAKAELEALRQQQAVLIQRLQAPPMPEPPPLPPPAPLTPRREDYQDEAGFIAAMVDHELAKRDAVHSAQQKNAVWQQRMSQGAERFADFDAVINNPAANPAPAIQPVLYEAVCDSEDGAALLYALGKDLALLRRLNTMTPIAAAREVGRLEAALAAQRQAPPAKPPVRTTTTPPPRPIQQPVTGGGAPAPVGGFRAGMGLREYEAIRRQERGRR